LFQEQVQRASQNCHIDFTDWLLLYYGMGQGMCY